MSEVPLTPSHGATGAMPSQAAPLPELSNLGALQSETGIALSQSRASSLANGHIALSAPQEAWRFIRGLSDFERELYFGGSDENWKKELQEGKAICKALVYVLKHKPYHEACDVDVSLCRQTVPETTAGSQSVLSIRNVAEDVLAMENIATEAFESYKDIFPTSIWHCCRRFCFTSIAIEPGKLLLFHELKLIHEVAEKMHASIRKVKLLVERRRRGVGGSSVGLSAPTRLERESDPGTLLQRAHRKFADMVIKVLPFLYGKEDAPSGTRCPHEKLCTHAICCLLGVSRKFVYGRKKAAPGTAVPDHELTSVIDTAGIRMRQHRRQGDRHGYPEIEDLPSYECGCEVPCLRQLNVFYLVNEYKAFARCAKELHPRRKENRFLLNALSSPFSNSPVQTCGTALSALYTVSKLHIADIRLTLQQMCADPSVDHRSFIAGGVEGYRKHALHPMNRYPAYIRDKIETHLDLVLRADPAGSNGISVCRVYSPEINTKEKLRKLLSKALDDDDTIDDQLSASTLQRIVEKYLRDRRSRIEFSRSQRLSELQNPELCCPAVSLRGEAVEPQP